MGADREGIRGTLLGSAASRRPRWRMHDQIKLVWATPAEGVLAAAVGMAVAAGLFAGPAALVQAEPAPLRPRPRLKPPRRRKPRPPSPRHRDRPPRRPESGASESGASGSESSGSGPYGAGSSAAVAAGATSRPGVMSSTSSPRSTPSAPVGTAVEPPESPLQAACDGLQAVQEVSRWDHRGDEVPAQPESADLGAQDTIAYQQKIQAQTQILQQAQSRQNANSAVMGAGQMPGDSNPGYGQPGAPSPVAPAPLPPTP